MTLKQRAKRIKVLLCDVDGVLTDGSVFVCDKFEGKYFSVVDGLGISLLRSSGIKVGWISGRKSTATQKRAKELKIDFLYQGIEEKTKIADCALRHFNSSWENTCYIGDDILDLGPLNRAGLAIAVNNAMPIVKKSAHYITKMTGGKGAVREIVDLILTAQRIM